MQRAIQICREQGGLPLTLKQYKVRMPGDLKTDESYFNRELSLQRDVDVLRREVSAENLAYAEQAVNSGLEVDYPATDVVAFYDILLRHHHAQGVPCVSEEWVRALIDSGMYSFALGRIKGRVVVATMVKLFKKSFSFPLSCVLPGRQDAEVSAYGLYWELICRFAKDGLEIFHSGRIPKTQETVDFRLGWGGTICPYYHQYHPNTGGPTEFSRRRVWKRRMVSAAWKRMPLSVTRRLDPVLVRRLP